MDQEDQDALFEADDFILEFIANHGDSPIIGQETAKRAREEMARRKTMPTRAM